MESAPEILKHYISLLGNNNTEHDDYRVEADNFAWVNMKIAGYSDEGEYVKEYYRSGIVETVFISDKISCGNFVIGSLLSKAYPHLKTLIVDRYRMNIIDCEVENFMAVSTQGPTNPFDKTKKLTNVKWVLFDNDDVYNSEYWKDFDTNLEGIVFKIKNRIGYYPPKGWKYRFIDSWIIYEKL